MTICIAIWGVRCLCWCVGCFWLLFVFGGLQAIISIKMWIYKKRNSYWLLQENRRPLLTRIREHLLDIPHIFSKKSKRFLCFISLRERNCFDSPFRQVFLLLFLWHFLLMIVLFVDKSVCLFISKLLIGISLLIYWYIMKNKIMLIFGIYSKYFEENYFISENGKYFKNGGGGV